MSNKENKKKRSKIVKLIVLSFLFSLIVVLSRLYLELKFSYSILIGLGGVIIIYILGRFKIIKLEDKDEEREKNKEFVKTLDTKTLKQLIKDQNKFLKVADKEYDKRKDKGLGEKIGNEVWNILEWGIIIFIMGLIMFGGIPTMFGVNNEFTNPSIPYNFSMDSSDIFDNVTNSYGIVEKAVSYPFKVLMEVGERQPIFWFWFFWAAVFMGVILPIITIIYYIIKSIGGKKGVYR